MSSEHNAGDLDVMIDERGFEGAYRTMAKGVNEMVAGHISVKKKAMACVAEFAKGNFEAELERFPGKKALISDNIAILRQALTALVTDADTLANAAVEGRLATRADASKHNGDYRKIVQGVNETLDAVLETWFPWSPTPHSAHSDPRASPQRWSMPRARDESSNGSSSVTLAIGSGLTLGDIFFDVFSGDWGASVRITSITFQ